MDRGGVDVHRRLNTAALIGEPKLEETTKAPEVPGNVRKVAHDLVVKGASRNDVAAKTT